MELFKERPAEEEIEEDMIEEDAIEEAEEPEKKSKQQMKKKSTDAFFEGYILGELLGEGGMGRVFVAKKDGKEYALKTLIPDKGRLKNLEKEVKASAVLSHPGIAKIYDYNLNAETPFIVREFRPEYAPLNHRKAIDLDDLVKLAKGVAEALAYAHSKGIVHGDIKPGNMLVNENYDVLLTDFGIAKFISEINSKISSIQSKEKTGTDKDSLCSIGIEGTIAFLAPEQQEGEQASPQTDIYALGKVLYYILTKKMPGTDAQKVLGKNGVPQDLAQIIVKALSSIEERYETMEDMLEALKAYQKQNTEEALLAKEKNLNFLKAQKKQYILADAIKGMAYTIIPNIPLILEATTGILPERSDNLYAISVFGAVLYLGMDLVLSYKGLKHSLRAVANAMGYFKGDYETDDIYKDEYAPDGDSLDWWGRAVDDLMKDSH